MILSGFVVKGKGEGRKLGFPTANVALQLPVPSGIYAGTVSYKGKDYRAALFIDGSKELLEAHLIGFKGELYGEKLAIEIGRKIRDAVPFESDEQMRALIEKDIKEITG